MIGQEALHSAPAASAGVNRKPSHLMEALRRNFETVAMAKVSTSAIEARRLHLLSAGDGITMNRERLLSDAKELAREIALGHPLGCTGAKLTASLLQEMKRRKARYGMVTVCVGGGMGAAGIFEDLN